MAEASFHEVVWTEALLNELAEKLEEKGVRSRSSIDRICDGIRTTFPEGEITHEAYAHLIGEMPGPDPDDHEHSAAAVAAGASFLITNDTTGFPAAALRRRGVTVSRPDVYLQGILDAFPRELLDVVRQMAADKVRPPMTVEDVLNALERAGAKRFARAARALLPR